MALNTYSLSHIFFIFGDDLIIEIERGIIFLWRSRDEFVVLARDRLKRDLNLLKEKYIDVPIIKCLSEDMLTRFTGDAQYIVLPINTVFDHKPPEKVFGEAKQVAVLRLGEVCSINSDEFNRFKEWFISELKKSFPTMDDEVINSIRDYEWAVLYLARADPSHILEVMKAEAEVRMRSAEKSSNSFIYETVSRLINSGYYLRHAISKFMLVHGPIEIPVYVANQFVLPGIPKVVSIIHDYSQNIVIYVEDMTMTFS